MGAGLLTLALTLSPVGNWSGGKRVGLGGAGYHVYFGQVGIEEADLPR